MKLFCSQLRQIEGIYVNKFDAHLIAIQSSTPFELVRRSLPIFFKLEALEICTLEGNDGSVKLNELGVIAIQGECFLKFYYILEF